MNLSKITICSIIVAISCSFMPIQATFADDDDFKIIRFYKLNKKEQQNRLVMREKRLKKAGCHNFRITPTIYKLTQIGYSYCVIYTKKNCPAGAEIIGNWKGKKQDSKFTQGGAWFFNQTSPRGEKAKSWHCHLK